MKVLQIIPCFRFGGAEIMCKNLILAQAKLGCSVTVVSLYGEYTPIARQVEAAGVRVIYLDKKLGMDVSMFGKLTGIMRREKPDVVHTHLDVIKYATVAAKLAGIRKCVHTVHTLAHIEAEGPIQKITNKLFFKLGWSVPVALSPEVQESIADFYNLDRARIPVICNGVELSHCMPKEDYEAGETVNILHVGRFDPPKNHEGLLRSFRLLLDRCPRCHLHLVGDGELRPSMEALAEELKLTDSVSFHGIQENVYPYLHDADIFVLPSVYEGIPMTVIEAMGTGLPIVATKVGGVPDLLRSGENGILVPCEAAAVADALERLVRDPVLRERIGRQAKEDSSGFSAATMARRYGEVYRS